MYRLIILITLSFVLAACAELSDEPCRKSICDRIGASFELSADSEVLIEHPSPHRAWDVCRSEGMIMATTHRFTGVWYHYTVSSGDVCWFPVFITPVTDNPTTLTIASPFKNFNVRIVSEQGSSTQSTGEEVQIKLEHGKTLEIWVYYEK